MRSNYKRLGNYIREVDIRNTDLSINLLLGISIQKIFIPSIANTIGTDMTTYKIVRKNQFGYGTVTSRNGDKISIALLENHDEAIVSQAYKVFEIIDEKKLLPEYLMMWFRRPEFDRYARFKSHGSAREIFDWDEMCDVELPVPDITKQQEIVDEYNTIKKRIELNNTLIAKLEETAQAVYRQWFVDFEFPDENGNPYKSSGGEMEFCEELEKEVPKGWKVGNIKKIMDFIQGSEPGADSYSEKKENNDYVQFYRVQDISTYGGKAKVYVNKKTLKNRLFTEKDILISLDGTIGKIFFGSEGGYSSGIRKVEGIYDFVSKIFILCFLKSDYFYQIIDTSSGSETTIKHAGKTLEHMFISYNENILENFNKITYSVFDNLLLISKENKDLEEMKDLILSKMASEE